MVKKSRISKSAVIRARSTHPIIDIDGHTIEFDPWVLDSLYQVGGHKIVANFQAWRFQCLEWYRLSPVERQQLRPTRVPWWVLPTRNALERASATLPKLRYERMDEIGIDFAIVYPSLGILIPHIEDEELRRSTCRAFNRLNASIYREFSARLTPAAIIPMQTPEEAITEMEYCVTSLGMKVAMLASYVRRPLPSSHRAASDNRWIDTFGIDSAYDYDRVWAKCLELQIVPTFHSTGMGWGSRTSISNYVYNHIGSFAAAAEAVCKSLFLGGVTRRFPRLNFVFLEGGAGWACNLYSDLVNHWQKRNPQALKNYDPEELDVEELSRLYREHGGKMMDGKVLGFSNSTPSFGGLHEDPSMLDEWGRCQIKHPDDIRALFTTSFHFGSEADDSSIAWAFNTRSNPLGAKLKVLLGSDIGHWDVPDMTKVVEEAYELVEKGLLDDHEFRDLTFANPVACYGAVNPTFFKDTTVETYADELLSHEHALPSIENRVRPLSAS